MKTECYLIVSAKESRYFQQYQAGPIRVTRKKPNCKSNEVAIKVNLDLPDALFKKPQLEINLFAPEPEQARIDPEVQDRIADLLRDQTGMSATVRFEAPEDEQS